MERRASSVIGRSLDFINHRSLDAPFVAVLWVLIISRDSGSEPALLRVAVLGASVWMVYASDRWMDGRHARNERASRLHPRHAFARAHARQIATIWVGVCLLTTGIALGFGERLFLVRGLYLLTAALLYFILVHRSAAVRRWAARAGLKEVSTAGFLWLAVSAVAQSNPVPASPVALSALGLFWLNALAVSRAEANPEDSAWRHPWVGRISTATAGAILFTALAAGSPPTPESPLLLPALITATLGLILTASVPGILQRYPSLADLAISLPLLLPLAFPHT